MTVETWKDRKGKLKYRTVANATRFSDLVDYGTGSLQSWSYEIQIPD